ncbi:hypothetical protein [Yersinia aleksiciae]|uniref:hypothetical protein n=1 Tax=Yersinia aleksiciae TaxID=263819 RepID=UPI0011A175C2|nr:hypothetical protein [Yersinia aleksiciae]
MKPMIILIILQLISFNSWGSLYPVLSDIKIRYISSSYLEISFTQMLVDIGPAGDVVVPWSGSYDEYMGIGAVSGQHSHYNFFHASNPTLLKYGETYSTAALRAYYGGHSTVTSKKTAFILSGKVRLCVGYAITSDAVRSKWSNPPGMCFTLPPAEEWCKMTSPALVLDHGRLSVKEAEGHSVSDTLNIQCSTSSAVTLRLMNMEKFIHLSDTARANIFVNGSSIGSVYGLKAGDNVLTISDQLTGITKPGELSGMAVLVIELA